MHDARTIFFVGKPGCGKGTQADLLSKKTGWPVFASGKLFRDISKEDSPLGRRIDEEVNKQGMLGPDWLAMYFYLRALFSLKQGQNAIFDGFNRKPPEAQLIVSSLTWFGRSFTIFNIAISDAEAEKRITLRKQTSGRRDDESLEQRLAEYGEYTAPAIAIFRDAGVLVEINGEQPPEKIAEDIRAALRI